MTEEKAQTTIYGTLHTQALKVLVWASDEAVIVSICGPATYPDERLAYRPRNPQWVDFLGDVEHIPEDEAIQRSAQGLPVAATFLSMLPAAPGLGIAAGRENAPTPIKDGTQIFFPGLVAARGEVPGAASVHDALPHAIYWYALEGRLVQSPTYR